MVVVVIVRAVMVVMVVAAAGQLEHREDGVLADGLGTVDRGPARLGDPSLGAARGERRPAR